MSIVINTNIASIDAQRNLSQTQQRLQQNLSHLSSGLRVNTAADDAAGLAISQGLQAQTVSLDQASRNANDGISLVQTANGALTQVSAILQRGRQLATEAANGTVTNADRVFINNEFSSLKGELDRIVGGTTFNGAALLDGSTRQIALQVGSGTTANDQLNVNLFGATAATGSNYATATTALTADTTLNIGVAGQTVALNFTAAADTLTTVAKAIDSNATLKGFGVTAKVVAVGASFALQINGSSNFTTAADTGSSILTGGVATPAYSAAAGLASAKTTDIGYDATSGTFLSAATLDTSANAISALNNIDQAIRDVASINATLGVSQNRLQFSISNLATESQNFTAANSRIVDVDVASETAAMTRNNILSQAGLSVLAQTNQLPQQALSLLGGR